MMVAKKHDWTEDELIAKILEKTDEKEFFKDIVKWMRHVLAPTKRLQIIEDIRGWSRTSAATRRLSHSDFCMFIFWASQTSGQKNILKTFQPTN